MQNCLDCAGSGVGEDDGEDCGCFQHSLSLLVDMDDTVEYLCSCGETFLSSPCGAINVLWNPIDKRLFSACPKDPRTQDPRYQNTHDHHS